MSIYELNEAERRGAAAARLEGSEDALVARPKLEVEIRRLPHGGAPFILALKEGKTFGEAAVIAAEEAPSFELEANLAGLLASGAIIGGGPNPLTRRYWAADVKSRASCGC